MPGQGENLLPRNGVPPLGRIVLAAGERPRVVRVERARGEWSAQATAWLGELPDAAHDFVYARARIYAHAAAEPLLLIATSGGNKEKIVFDID